MAHAQCIHKQLRIHMCVHLDGCEVFAVCNIERKVLQHIPDIGIVRSMATILPLELACCDGQQRLMRLALHCESQATNAAR